MASDDRTASALNFVSRSCSAREEGIGEPISVRLMRPHTLRGACVTAVASRSPVRTLRNAGRWDTHGGCAHLRGTSLSAPQDERAAMGLPHRLHSAFP